MLMFDIDSSRQFVQNVIDNLSLWRNFFPYSCILLIDTSEKVTNCCHQTIVNHLFNHPRFIKLHLAMHFLFMIVFFCFLILSSHRNSNYWLVSLTDFNLAVLYVHMFYDIFLNKLLYSEHFNCFSVKHSFFFFFTLMHLCTGSTHEFNPALTVTHNINSITKETHVWSHIHTVAIHA